MIRVALAVFLFATSAIAEPGHDLFTGQDPSASNGRVARFACHSCHGRDGRGGIEGNVPAIAGDALRRPTDLRLAYDLGAFRRAVTKSIDPNGGKLSRLMPRYDLTEAELSNLWDYLQNLPRLQAQGVDATSVKIGVIVDADQPELGQHYIRKLDAELALTLPGGNVFGRTFEIVPLTDPVAQAHTVLAAVAMPPGRTDLTKQLVASGLPVLFPLTSLHGTEDVSIQRAFSPSDRAVDGAIAEHLATTAARRIGIIATPERAQTLASLISLEVSGAKAWPIGPDSTLRTDSLDAVVSLDGPPPEGMAANTILYQTASSSRSQNSSTEVQSRYLVIEAPNLINLAIKEGVHPLDAHAMLTARVLTRALLASGRELTRSSLLAGLDAALLGSEGLDYKRFPLTGTEYIKIIAMPRAP